MPRILGSVRSFVARHKDAIAGELFLMFVLNTLLCAGAMIVIGRVARAFFTGVPAT